MESTETEERERDRERDKKERKERERERERERATFIMCLLPRWSNASECSFFLFPLFSVFKKKMGKV